MNMSELPMVVMIALDIIECAFLLFFICSLAYVSTLKIDR